MIRVCTTQIPDPTRIIGNTRLGGQVGHVFESQIQYTWAITWVECTKSTDMGYSLPDLFRPTCTDLKTDARH